MMSAMSMKTIAKETGVEIEGDVLIHRVNTDSRTVQAGDLFVALSGDRFDGNQFVAGAANAGAVAAVVTREVDCDIPCLKVSDSRLALGQISGLNRQQFKGPLVALTGSAGKTTTKEMLASILAQKGRVLATEGNLNNEIGVPLTLLKIDVEHEFAVIEMGAARRGDIRYLAQFAQPTVSILTNAMPVHIESFGDVETIAKTKGEILEALPASGIAVINMDSPFYEEWVEIVGERKYFSFSKHNESADFYASAIGVNKFGETNFILHANKESIPVSLALLGEHNIANALAASAAATAAGAAAEDIKAGLENVLPVAGRLKTNRVNDLVVIDDTYNASPGSVKAAIDVLENFEGVRCLVLGVMGELGDLAEAGHREVAAYAKDKNIERLVAVGEYSDLVVKTFAGAGGNAKAYDTMDDALGDLAFIESASTVLVKGSRSARMERVVRALLGEEGKY